ncbi:MAG: hypothetical protein D6797_07075, partial [Bdellovibrio sp.]
MKVLRKIYLIMVVLNAICLTLLAQANESVSYISLAEIKRLQKLFTQAKVPEVQDLFQKRSWTCSLYG